ncbi:glycosyltransferase [Xanthobacter autotrophicus DSM 431]|uniref:glycosyltransferase n=1 Tax=Xanthobacter nonsaccharivorans TaxID=3119912 RepID=UPI00372BBD0F
MSARAPEPAVVPLAAPVTVPLPRALPPELRPFVGHLPAETLAAAAARARRLGVGADEVLVAQGTVDSATAARLFAAHLGVALAELETDPPAFDTAMAEAMLRTGVLLEAPAGLRPRYVVAARGREARRLFRALKADGSLPGRLRLAPPEALRRTVARAAGPAMTARAVTALLQARPLLSAASLRPARALAVIAGAVAALLAVLLACAPGEGLLATQMLLSLLFLSWIALRFAGCLFQPPEDEPALQDERTLPLYSVLVPLYREAASVPGLVAALSALDYPPEKLDIKLVVEADDADTRAAIAALRLPPHMEEVAVPAIGPRTKPKALDAALPFARGSFVAICDAEDLPEPDQLKRALAAFRRGGPQVACVQARLAVDNGADSLVAGHFAAEYAGQFDVLLPVLSALGLPILLGGTSNHFRRRVLEEVGGWDPFNVTEDADLGIRLARAGWQTRVIASTTYEEAPVTVNAWLGQRTRWLKGWAQTLMVHGRRPRALVRDLGPGATLALAVLAAGPFAAALVHPLCVAVLAVDVVRGVAGVPCTSPAEVLASALAYATLAAGYAGTVATSIVGLRRRGFAMRWAIALSIPAYWLLLSVAAWRAVVELARRPHFWRKTEHGLARRRAATGTPVRSSASAPPPPRPAAAWN